MSPDALQVRIHALTDREAIQALSMLAEDRGLLDAVEHLPSSAEALEGCVDPSDLSAYGVSGLPVVSDGELARAALEYVAGLPDWVDTVEEAAEYVRAPAERLDPVSAPVILLVIVILQTDIKFTRNTRGKWSLTIHKKAARDSTLGKVIRGLLSQLGQ